MRRRLEVVASPDYVQTMLAANSPGRERLARGPIGQGVRHGIQTLYVGVPPSSGPASPSSSCSCYSGRPTGSQAISSSTGSDGERFFEDAIKSLGGAGGAAGETIGNSTGANPVSGAVGGASGSVEVPLFVTFLAAVIGAFAAFFVWIELLMRDAAVYAVALFLPLALAASTWPRWSGALRRTAELMAVVIASKFVIVAIISLAASLASHNAGHVEQILAASALMLLACFAPRPRAEGSAPPVHPNLESIIRRSAYGRGTWTQSVPPATGR
jgi:hypothetical protein